MKRRGWSATFWVYSFVVTMSCLTYLWLSVVPGRVERVAEEPSTIVLVALFITVVLPFAIFFMIFVFWLTWRECAVLVGIVGVTWLLSYAYVPTRIGFLWSKSALESFRGEVEASMKGDWSDEPRTAGWYSFDAAARDKRGGIYFRTEAYSVSPRWSYGFCYRANVKKSRFGVVYTYPLLGDWGWFEACD